MNFEPISNHESSMSTIHSNRLFCSQSTVNLNTWICRKLFKWKVCNFLESWTHFVARNMVSIQHQIFEKVTILSYVKLNFSTQKASARLRIAVLKQAWKELLERYYYFIAGLLDRILDFSFAAKIRLGILTWYHC